MLANFPENYRLYEHVVKRAEDGPGSKGTMGGVTDRLDSYLYGHPLGRKKRYRSPNDFYHHVLWLATDQAGDKGNCTCKLCCPDEFNDKVAPPPTNPPPLKIDAQGLTKPASQPTSPLIGVQADRPKSAQTNQAAAPAQRAQVARKPSSASVGTSQAHAPSNTLRHAYGIPPAPPRVKAVRGDMTQDQYLDTTDGTFIHRQGEVVWFHRMDAWNLGIILQRWTDNTATSTDKQCVYIIQPILHPMRHSPPTSMAGHDLLRPWLAWSTPPYLIGMIAKMGTTYQTADWQGLLSKKYGEGNVDVDGSILAAKAVDCSYTPFALLGPSKAPSAHSQYRGIYLGGEKVWVGDIVRIKQGDLLLVKEIFEQPNSGVKLRGDVLHEAEYTQIASHGVPIRQPRQTPITDRLLHDTEDRNAHLVARGMFVGFELVNANAIFPQETIAGRWYETMRLVPILNPSVKTQSALVRLLGVSVGAKFNKRIDSCKHLIPANAVPEDVRTDERLQIIASAMPSGTVIVDGTGEGPGPDAWNARIAMDAGQDMQAQIEAQQDGAQQIDQQVETSGHGMDIDPALDLDTDGMQQQVSIDDFMNIDD